jgi:hypothetical protein
MPTTCGPSLLNRVPYSCGPVIECVAFSCSVQSRRFIASPRTLVSIVFHAHHSSHAHAANLVYPRSSIKMANDMSEDNAETQTDDPATLKVLRGNAKRRFTNLVKLVRDLMADHGNRTSIKNRREDIIGAFQECSHFNNCYIAIRPDDGSSAAWISRNGPRLLARHHRRTPVQQSG